MRLPLIAAILVMLLGLAGDARGETYEPSFDRIRASLARDALVLHPVSSAVERIPTRATLQQTRAAARGAPARQAAVVRTNGRDSLWNGALIGAGIGAGAGYLWGRNLCGSNDEECSVRAIPAGVLGGAAIGAAVGAVLDALQK